MRWLARSLLLLILFPIGGTALLLGTETGLQWVVRQAGPFSGDRLEITAARGRLLGEIRLRGVRYHDPHTTLSAEELRLRWDPFALLHGRLRVTTFETKGLHLSRRRKKEPTQPFRGFSLPLTVRLERAVIRDLRFGEGEGKPVAAYAIRLHATLHDTTLTIHHLAIEAPQGEMTVSGRLDTSAELPFDLGARWRWNAPPSSPFTASGILRIRGTPRHYRFEAGSELPSDRFSTAKLELTGTGDLSGIRLERIRAHWLDGEWLATGRLGWKPHLKWEATLSATGIDPALAWKGWPGTRIELRLEGKGEGKEFEVALHRLHGRIQNHPLTASARFRYADGILHLARAQLDSGSAHFTLSGSVGERWDTAWRFTAPDLSHLWPDLEGTADASGRISGPHLEPALQARLKGEGLRWKEHFAREVEGRVEASLQPDRPWRVEAEIGGIRLGKIDLRRISLTGGGLTRNHSLHLRVERNGTTRLESRIRGGLEKGIWHGAVEGGRLVLPDQEWKQRRDARLQFGKGKASLAPWCWWHDAARICLEGGRADGGWLADLTVQKLKLAWLRPLLPPGSLTFTGLLEGRAQIAYQEGRLDGSRMELRLHDGKLRYPTTDDEDYEVAYRELRLKAEKLPELLAATLALDLGETGGARGHWRLPGWRLSSALAKEQPLEGELTAKLDRLTPLALLTPRIQRPVGKVTGRLAIGGTLGAPRIDGQARLDGGSLTLPDLGITLREITLRATTHGGTRLLLEGGARSGPGTLSLEGELDFGVLPRWRGRIHLQGKTVEVARIPEAKVVASPDLEIRIRPRFVQLSGHLEVPEARIRLPEKQGLVPASPDVVVIGEDGGQAGRKRWRIATTLVLKLGDGVEVSGHGFDGRISGQLAIVESPDRPAIAQGELEIHDGSYKIYGQKLHIDEGRLLYAASPLTNPGLQFRVVRRQREVEAGILVFGRLKKPELQLFSSPPMDDSDILAYILIGKPLREATTSEGDRVSQAARSLQLAGGTWLAKRLGKELDLEEVSIESGTGDAAASLVLGKYLSPRLYVQYVIGLTEGGNILRARYEINRNWILESESGQHSGVDLLFTLER